MTELELDPSFLKSQLEDYFGVEERILSREAVDSEVLSAITDSYGNIRLGRMRDYLSHPKQANVDFLQEVFLKWVTSPEALLLMGTHCETGEKIRIGVKCSKRGNDIFNERIDKKLSFLEGLKTNGIELFPNADFTLDKKVSTSLLWVTLTYDSKLRTLDEAWRNIEQEFNLFITNLRNKYGEVFELKFVQAFPGKKQGKRGEAFAYPHIHAVILFKEAQFSVFPELVEGKDGDDSNSKDRETSFRYRIHQKDELTNQGGWHSYIDVQALRTFKAVSNYCRKYAQGTYNVVNDEGEVNDEALLNCAMGWFYRKQSYSVSRGLREELSDLISPLQVSKAFSQTCLDGSPSFPVWLWESKGVRSWSELRTCGLDPPGDQFDIDADIFERLVRRQYHREKWRDD